MRKCVRGGNEKENGNVSHAWRKCIIRILLSSFLWLFSTGQRLLLSYNTKWFSRQKHFYTLQLWTLTNLCFMFHQVYLIFLIIILKIHIIMKILCKGFLFLSYTWWKIQLLAISTSKSCFNFTLCKVEQPGMIHLQTLLNYMFGECFEICKVLCKTYREKLLNFNK